MSINEAQDINDIAKIINGVLLQHGEPLKISQLSRAMELDILVVKRALNILELENKATKGIHGWRAA
jgi:chromosome segregation and condensation protein ScpB